MSPVPYTWGPFLAKIFLKIWFCKIDPLLPPHIDFNTIPYFTYGYPYRGVKEGKLKRVVETMGVPKTEYEYHFWDRALFFLQGFP